MKLCNKLSLTLIWEVRHFSYAISKVVGEKEWARPWPSHQIRGVQYLTARTELDQVSGRNS